MPDAFLWIKTQKASDITRSVAPSATALGNWQREPEMTKIEWVKNGKTWNPITGCTKTSGGCTNCYAERMAKRLAGRCGYPSDNPFRPGTLHEAKFSEPLRRRKPTEYFVCSMSDLFHSAVSDETIGRVLDVIRDCPQHRFMILTKRAYRLPDFSPYPANCWVGITAENQRRADERIPHLLEVKAPVRFISCEPLLGAVNLQTNALMSGLDWVIAGGETGPGARPMNPAWARSLRDQCLAADTPFFFKRHGGVRKSFGDRLLDGREWNQRPVGKPRTRKPGTIQSALF
jgi:protein gp37